MTMQVGAIVVDVLERAGWRHLGQVEPDAYRTYLWQVAGSDALRRHDGSETYWDRVQAILDCFFTSRQRAEVCGQLLARPELRALPTAQCFLVRARAERRVQGLAQVAILAEQARAGSARNRLA